MITALKEFKNSFYEALDINQATLSGCRDIVCVIQEDGTIKSSSFHVRFGKLKVLRPKEKEVKITINGVTQDIKMRLASSGEGYFEEERKKIEKKNPLPKKLNEINYSPDINLAGMSDDNISDLDLQSGSASEEEDEKKKNNEEKKDLIKANQIMIKNEKDSQKNEKDEKSRWKLWGLFNRDKKNVETQKSPAKDQDKFNKEISLPEIILPASTIESSKEIILNENKLDISKAIPIKFSTEENIVEIRSEHLSRKNSIDELNASKVVPQNQKKGIITWFSEKFSKDKKQLKNSAIEVEENKLGFKENKEIFIEKAIMEEDIENLIKSTNEDKSSINNQSIIIDNTGISQTNKEENPITPITINNENIIINDNVAKKNIANEPNINKKENLNYIQNQVNEINENFNEKIDETLQQSTEIIEEVEENAVELSICAHLINQKNEEDLTEIFNANKVLEEHYFKDPIKVLTNPNLMVKIEDHLYEWKIAEPLIIAKLVYHQDLPESVLRDVMKTKKGSGWKIFNWFSSSKSKKNSKPLNENEIIGKKSPKESPIKQTNNDKKIEKEVSSHKLKGNFRKSLKPNNNILKSFNLKFGKNTIVYSVTTEYQGTSTLEAYIYLWKNNTKIVISDIDGTITKSDVLGQLMPIVGKKWCHEGVTKFFQNIKKNGYQILYLTARAIGQSQQTRNFLNSVLLDDTRLPEGPVFMSPDRLLESFQREVIFKKPELFKIACLREIRTVFHQEEGLYAGFGNKDTDAIAYRSVGITMGKIFIINEISEIHQLNNTYLKSYPELNEMVDLIFPPISEKVSLPPEEYNDLNFWKLKTDINVDFSKLL